MHGDDRDMCVRLDELETFKRRHDEEKTLSDHHDFVKRLEAVERFVADFEKQDEEDREYTEGVVRRVEALEASVRTAGLNIAMMTPSGLTRCPNCGWTR